MVCLWLSHLSSSGYTVFRQNLGLVEKILDLQIQKEILNSDKTFLPVKAQPGFKPESYVFALAAMTQI